MTRRRGKYDGKTLGNWQISKRIGHGGNAEVYSASSGNQSAALKILKNGPWGKRQLARFHTEIEAMRRYSDNPHVLPIFEANVPEHPTEANPPWFAMGKAEPLYIALGKEAKLDEIIEACAAFADALSQMHEKDDAHRDIKPDNLFRFENNWAVGDFGLVQLDGKISVTMAGDKIGAIHYIAPEMLNNAYEQDGKPADVYSLAKTIWVLATGQKYPLPGQMQKQIVAMRLSSYTSDSRSKSLEGLIEKATSVRPSDRPTMAMVASELKAWLKGPTRPIMPQTITDLSEFALEIGLINEDFHIREKEAIDQQTFIISNQDRIMEQFRPLIEQFANELTAANFVYVRMSEPNRGNSGSLFVAGQILATSWRGEVELYFDTHVSVQANGQTRLLCRYTANVAEDGRISDWQLWDFSKTFLADGIDESLQIETGIAESRSHFRRCVERVFRMSKGAEGSPPRKQ